MIRTMAKEDDLIVARDAHSCSGALITLSFSGKLDGALSPNVYVERKLAAAIDSTATNDPAHVAPPGTAFDKPPSNQGKVTSACTSVYVNNRLAARNQDDAKTCNDPVDAEVGHVVAGGRTYIGR